MARSNGSPSSAGCGCLALLIFLAVATFVVVFAANFAQSFFAGLL